jgi:hypothetical protein
MTARIRPTYQTAHRRAHSAHRAILSASLAVTLLPQLSRATSIDGVGAVAADQPQIHFYLTTPTSSDPVLADDGMGDTAYDVQAFLDTGTSGILLSQETAAALNINPTSYNGSPVTFYDTGVAGDAGMGVSDQYRLSLAPSLGLSNDLNAGGDPPTLDQYSAPSAPMRLQISNTPADDLIGPLDIVGTPVLTGNVMVVDPKPLNQFLTDYTTGDTLHTYLYPQGTAYKPDTADTDPGIPTVNRHIRLSLASFDRFTAIDPAAAPGPTQAGNPMIGPDPVLKLDGITQTNAPPPVTITMGSLSSTGSFLLDTGAQASFISDAEAAAVGVHYKPGTEGTDTPDLVDAQGNDLPNQFIEGVSGVGGTVSAAGFYLDSLTLPTTEGDPITFKNAPVLVTDVTVTDPITNQTITLDGDFGMNFLVASYAPDLNNSSASAFDWITYDQSAGILGLQLSTTVLPLTVTTGTTYHFTANTSGGVIVTSVGGINIAANAKAIVDLSADHNNRQLLAPSDGLTLAGSTGHWTGLLDLNNNDLDLPGESLATVTNQLAQGYNNGKWNGSGGIVSSAAATDATHLTALGVIQNNQNGSQIYSATNLFDDAIPDTTDILIKYTYYGDTNLDGIVDGTDYSRIDFAYLANRTSPASHTGWYNGDFNYDGVIDGSDYTLIDNAYNTQGAALTSLIATSTAQLAPTSPVPEPTALPFLLSGILATRRRNRSRKFIPAPPPTGLAASGLVDLVPVFHCDQRKIRTYAKRN